MQNFWRVSKFLWRASVPELIRKSCTVEGLKVLIGRLLPHDVVYDSEYYDFEVEGPAVRSAEVITGSVVRDLKPLTVVDVGCGTGAILDAFKKRRCSVLGLEYSDVAIRYCRARGLEVTKFDIQKDTFDKKCDFDVALSMEVAEHLPQKSADRYVELLTSLSHWIVFTAAPPGQGGTFHLNEQPPSYWRAKFSVLGFECNEELVRRWRDEWRTSGSVMSWYHKNLMIFQRKGSA